MKKYIFILWFFFLSYASTWGNDCTQSCRIYDAPAQILIDYIDNISKLSNNVSQELSTLSNEWLNPISKQVNRVITSLNAGLSFSDYLASFEYYVTYPLSNELPQAIKRDHDLLLTETEKLNKLLQTAIKRGTSHITLANICNGVNHCKLDGQSAQSIITSMIRNTQAISELYRANIIGKPFLQSNKTFILVPEDFNFNLTQNYNSDTRVACSSCEGNFLNEASKKIQNISLLNDQARDGIQSWKDSWRLLWWQDIESTSYLQEEERVLSDFLKEQWIPTKNTDIILENLRKSNTDGTGVRNPFTGFELTWQEIAINPRIQNFWEKLTETYNLLLWDGIDIIPYAVLSEVRTDIQQSADIHSSIATLYENELPYALSQNVGTQELQARILRMHFSLVRTSNLLTENIPLSEKLCNKQWVGWGQCSYRRILDRIRSSLQ